uniref:Metal tolerance protein 9 n=1 Tax=Nicotiana tabacum TaxID=4097 RepID=A0A1S3Y341_TOBAC|nr:PREDICTED: metal tolerance protein 9-like [Nicotiana tabacum]
MAGLQYYFFPTDFYYPRPPKINGNNNKNISTDDVAAAAPASVCGGVLETPAATGATLDRRDMLFQDKILKVSTPLSMKFVRYHPVLIALYTIGTLAKIVIENMRSLIGRIAPPEFLAKLTYLIWNHHKEIKHIDTVRAYTFGANYFVEVDIVLPEDMLLSQAHNIGETLQENLEQLPDVERAFVHVDFEFTH